ncbi:MAG: disulfide bond formation protein B [Planctomycetaceae bacterium]|nr:disulfide bond formation protein B [Planctomycetaceae bacterium]
MERQPTNDSLATVKKNVDEKRAVLVDVREKSEWDAGHIEGAVLLPLSELKNGMAGEQLAMRLPKDQIVYIHCNMGKRSSAAADILERHGFDVRPLNVGCKELPDAGFTRVTESDLVTCGADAIVFSAAKAWLVAVIVMSFIGTIGSVYLSVGLGLKACPLCFYQRSFMMATLVVAAVGIYIDRSRPGLLGLLSVPMASAGLGVAAFHEYLVLTRILECPNALFGFGTAPAQSLVVFVLLTIATTASAWAGRGESSRQGRSCVASAIIVGLVLAWACIASSPPLPPVPTIPYDPIKQPLDMCRPPFRG